MAVPPKASLAVSIGLAPKGVKIGNYLEDA
jgi:hypothetical protein